MGGGRAADSPRSTVLVHLGFCRRVQGVYSIRKEACLVGKREGRLKDKRNGSLTRRRHTDSHKRSMTRTGAQRPVGVATFPGSLQRETLSFVSPGLTIFHQYPRVPNPSRSKDSFAWLRSDSFFDSRAPVQASLGGRALGCTGTT